MSVPPQGPPPGWPSQQPQYWHPPPGQQPWVPAGPPTPKGHRGLFIGLAVIVLVCITGFAGLMINAADRADVTDDERIANARVAQLPQNFDTVCEDGSVSNAAPLRKPYTIVAFEQGAGFVDWSSMSMRGDAPFAAGDDVTEINVVACVTRKPGTQIKQGACDIESGGEHLTVDRFSVDYTVELREARTGRFLADLGTVPGPSDRCPFISFLDGKSPKIFGAADTAAVEAKLSEFAGA